MKLSLDDNLRASHLGLLTTNDPTYPGRWLQVGSHSPELSKHKCVVIIDEFHSRLATEAAVGSAGGDLSAGLAAELSRVIHLTCPGALPGAHECDCLTPLLP
jgi:hypothetical protein